MQLPTDGLSCAREDGSSGTARRKKRYSDAYDKNSAQAMEMEDEFDMGYRAVFPAPLGRAIMKIIEKYDRYSDEIRNIRSQVLQAYLDGDSITAGEIVKDGGTFYKGKYNNIADIHKFNKLVIAFK